MDRKNLKDKAKKNLKKFYWGYVAICFLLAFFAFEYNSSISSLRSHNGNNVKQQIGTLSSIKVNLSDISFDGKLDTDIIQNTIVDSSEFTASNTYIFKLAGTIKNIVSNKYQKAVFLFSACLLSICYNFFFAYPITVGSRRFFLNVKDDKNPKIGDIFDAFKRNSYLNVVKVMALKAIYILLWSFTIIGGIIKFYEYRMIPYIMAEDPNINKKDAFLKSKIMMKNYKWKTFVLDLSFIGWYLLNILSFGLVGILFSNPYHAATITELYEERKKAL